MGGVIDGQDVNQTITNAAFIEKNANDTMPFLLAFTAVSEGANIASIQAAANKLYACTGASESTTGTVYGAPASTITDGQSHQTALTELANKFDPSTGHRHTGAAGDAPAISAGGITNVPLLGYIEKAGTNVTATGASTDVSAILSGKSPSTSSSTLGIPTTPPNNKVKLFYASGAPTLQDPIDSTGNIVYGRITFSASVWTLSYFSEIAGAETSYAGFSSTSLIWYFQELFNPLNSASAPPVYAQENNLLGSSYVAAIPTSTTSIAGKTTLSSATPPAVAAAGSAGTANGTVANANHTHAGVASIAASGSTPLLAAVTMTGTTPVVASESGQNIDFTLGANSVTNSFLATMVANTVKANVTGSTAQPTDVSAVSAATASTFMIRDSNANVRINSIIENYTTTATAAATTTLSVSSSKNQYFTGSTTQTVKLPDATTLVLGQQFLIHNRSSGIVTVNDNASGLVKALGSNSDGVFTVTNIGSAAGTWDVTSAAASAGTVTSVQVAGVNGLSFTGGPITGSGTITAVLTPPLVTKYTSGSGTHSLTGSPIAIIVIMNGAGGGGATSGTVGSTAATDGGNTTFGTGLLAANGGTHAVFASSYGSGGTASLGSGPTGIALTGANGQGLSAAGAVANSAYIMGSQGGSSPFGGAGNGGNYGSAGITASANTGSGGGGGGDNGIANSNTGAGGGAGGYIYAFISGATLSGLSGSAAYAVGAGGSGGAAGTSGFAGGAGASGVLIIIELYQ